MRVGFAAGLLFVGWFLIGSSAAAAAEAQPGRKIENFTLSDIRGKSWSLADVADQKLMSVRPEILAGMSLLVPAVWWHLRQWRCN